MATDSGINRSFDAGEDADATRETGDDQSVSPPKGLPAIKMSRFHGHRARYEEWKRELEATRLLYKLEESQVAGLAYLALDAGPDNAQDD